MPWLSRVVLLGGIPDGCDEEGGRQRGVSCIAHALKASRSSLSHFKMYDDVTGAASGWCAGEDDPVRFMQKPVEHGYSRRGWM